MQRSLARIAADESGCISVFGGGSAAAGDPTFFGRTLNPVVSDLPPNVVSTFAGGKVTPSVTADETIMYRVWGDQGGRTGSYLTRTAPANAAEAMEKLALSPSWGNSRVFVSKVKVRAGTPIYEGTAAPQGILGGGGKCTFHVNGCRASNLARVTRCPDRMKGRNMRASLEVLLRGMREGDGRVCGDAPEWIIEKVASNLESLMAEHLADDALRSSLDEFVTGATRFVADQCGSECYTLLSALSALRHDTR